MPPSYIMHLSSLKALQYERPDVKSWQIHNLPGIDGDTVDRFCRNHHIEVEAAYVVPAKLKIPGVIAGYLYVPIGSHTQAIFLSPFPK